MFFDIDSPFTMVVMIVFIAVGAGVVNNWLKMRSEQSATPDNSEEVAQLRKDVTALKSRVRVLEEIAVDKEHRLKEEISRLA